MPSTVLVITDRFDVTADYVVTELNSRGVPVFRFDPSEFPLRLTMDAALCGDWTGSLCTRHRSVNLADIGCAYYRKPSVFRLPDEMPEADRKWASREARIGLGGLLASLPNWLNHPSANAAAEFKPGQLRAAVRAGLTVPPTLLTNNPESVRRFADQVGQIIYKPLSGPVLVDHDTDHFLYTALVRDRDIGDPSVRAAANLFQQWVPKQFEVRLTVVDDRFFAARIDAGSARAAVDWRSDYDSLTYSTVDPPADVCAGVSRLLRALDLRFGALDFVVTPEDEWVMLEINPNGQWAWIQDETGLPIASAIADALTEGRPAA